MKIQINTDNHIKVNEAFAAKINDVVENALSRLSDRITRVEIHLSDENGEKSGQKDKRCVIEARLEGHKPIAVTEQAATVEQVIDGAAEKLVRLIESTLGRMNDQKSHRTDPPLPGIKLPVE